MYYSGRINTYKLDRTTLTVGAPRILVKDRYGEPERGGVNGSR
jgi:hypothetical protein